MTGSVSTAGRAVRSQGGAGSSGGVVDAGLSRSPVCSSRIRTQTKLGDLKLSRWFQQGGVTVKQERFCGISASSLSCAGL